MNHWLRNFFTSEAAGGMIMLISAALAMIFANTMPEYKHLIHLPIGSLDVHAVVSDVLMPIFFLFVGLELKNEMLAGELSNKRQRILPLAAAIGGIVMPALLYLAVTADEPLLHAGWAIPTATDIAFAICIVNLAGNRVPVAAKIFLLAIAIYDDLAAIIIIALFYSSALAIVPLIAAVAVIVLMVILNRATKAHPATMTLLGILLGALLYHAGVHTTVAGMVTGLCVGLPYVKPFINRLHGPVVFLVLPLFAFVSAGVDLTGIELSDMLTPLPVGIALGLFFGKQVGIFAATRATISLGLASMPKGMDGRMLHAIATIAGIGFTMSLFVGQLAFADALLQDALKIGVLGGSLLSALVGLGLLYTRPAVH